MDISFRDDVKDCINDIYYLSYDLNLFIFDYVKYKSTDGTNYEKLALAKRIFSFSDYLPNKIEIADNKIKMITISNERQNLIVLNFTIISDRIIIFDCNNFSILFNLYINTIHFYKQIDRNFYSSMVYLLNVLKNKTWSLQDIQNFNSVYIQIKNEKKNLRNIKLLVSILNNENDDCKKQRFKKFYNLFSELERLHPNELLYHSLVILIIFSYKINFDFFEILDNLHRFLNKISNLSLVYESGDFSNLVNIDKQIIKDQNISEFFNNFNKILDQIKKEDNNIDLVTLILLKIIKRNYNLEEILEINDKQKNNYFHKKEFLRIIKSIPIGITDEEADNFSNFMPKDEFGNILYKTFFQSEKYLLIKLIFENKRKLGNKSFGYLTKLNNIDIGDYYNCMSLEYVSNDYLEYSDINNILNEKVNKFDIDYRFLTFFKINSIIDSLVYIPSLSILFVITNEKSNSKISILKYSNVINNYSRIIVKTELIGFIETHSLYNPRLLTFITERNLLITQSIKRQNDENIVDLLIYDVYKDIFDLFQINSLWKINNPKIISNVMSDPLIYFDYLKGNKLFFLRSEKEIKIINPRTKPKDLSIKYYLDKNAEISYDRVCRNVCERMSEYVGENYYHVVKHLNIANLNHARVMSYPSFDSTYNINHPLDYIIMIKDKNILTGISVFTLTISIKAIDYDNEIPEYNEIVKYGQIQRNKLYNKIREKIAQNQAKLKELMTITNKLKLSIKKIITNIIINDIKISNDILFKQIIVPIINTEDREKILERLPFLSILENVKQEDIILFLFHGHI